ncbi:catabolic 3-dehydroquinase [Botrytis cinerea]
MILSAYLRKGRKNGDFNMHRESGRSVDLNVRLGRAIGKMKATITQKLVIDDISIAVECDSQFIFLCLIEDDGLEKYPEGYKYLAVAQHKIGYAILEDLPTMGRPFGKIYDGIAGWLRGEEVDLNWD